MKPPIAIGIGGSSGALEPLTDILTRLPREFPAAVLVTLHRHATSDHFLSMLMERKAQMTVKQAADGETIRPQTVYLAPPDLHLVVKGDRLRLSSGPRENRSRPSIDVMFRSLAVAAGSRTIGVLLSGLLNDGVDGLRSIAKCGGKTIVQDPKDAAFPEMPNHALAAFTPDLCITAEAIAARLAELLGSMDPNVVDGPTPTADMSAEVDMAMGKRLTIESKDRLGTNANITCPECGGVLWQISQEPPIRFRCHTGHGYTAEVLNEAEAEKVEETMWIAMRTLREHAESLRHMATLARPTERDDWHERARQADRHADQVAESLIAVASRPVRV